MRIGVDLDGVVSDFVSTFIGVVNEKYSVKLKQNQIYVHDLFLVLGVTKNEALSLIYETLSRDINVIEGAREALVKLKEKHEIVIITARPEGTYKTTQEWLEQNKIPYDTLLYIKEGEKNQTEIELDVFVDDHLGEIIEFYGKARKLIIFDHPWNKSLNVLRLFERARNWKEVLHTIESTSG